MHSTPDVHYFGLKPAVHYFGLAAGPHGMVALWGLLALMLVLCVAGLGLRVARSRA